ncbi:MAG: type II toxin-antitoxin system ParD family antitoxin [Methylococcaceae bacterium]|nr:type II toxin-antitoxin system ParD family antitoxin [Methylococcaceae bacterium]
MNFSLIPQLEIFVRERAASGDYNNASEVVREALRVFKCSEEMHVLKLKQLRAAIAEGESAIEQGDSHIFNSEQELDNFFAKL